MVPPHVPLNKDSRTNDLLKEKGLKHNMIPECRSETAPEISYAKDIFREWF